MYMHMDTAACIHVHALYCYVVVAELEGLSKGDKIEETEDGKEKFAVTHVENVSQLAQ